MYRAFSHLIQGELYKFIAIVITLYPLAGCSIDAWATDDPPMRSTKSVEAALEESGRLFAQRADTAKLREAIRTLAAARNADARDFQVEWRFAKYNYFLGKASTDSEDADAAFEKGRDAGRIAARLDEGRPEGHFWFAANMGELAKMNPLTLGLKSVDPFRESMKKVIAIDPSYEGASAFDALGQLEMATRRFKGGTAEKAVEYYEKGLRLSTVNANLRLHLAEAYLALDRDAEARKQIDLLIAMQPNPEYAAEHAAVVAKGRELLAKNF